MLLLPLLAASASFLPTPLSALSPPPVLPSSLSLLSLLPSLLARLLVCVRVFFRVRLSSFSLPSSSLTSLSRRGRRGQPREGGREKREKGKEEGGEGEKERREESNHVHNKGGEDARRRVRQRVPVRGPLATFLPFVGARCANTHRRQCSDAQMLRCSCSGLASRPKGRTVYTLAGDRRRLPQWHA